MTARAPTAAVRLALRRGQRCPYLARLPPDSPPMLTCSRCGLAALVLLALAFTGCDTNNGGSGTLGDLEGVYALTELRFDPQTPDLSDADLGARLLASGNPSLEIFPSVDDFALLRTPETGRTDLEVRVFSNALEFTAVTPDDEDDLAELFLPATFRLTFSSPTARELSAELFRPAVDLEQFDPDRYDGLPPVSGTLFVRFNRP